MDAGISGRLRLAALVAAVASMLATALVVAADSARSGDPGDALEPDLVVQRPYELYVDKGAEEIRLRVSNTVANIGDGPLEISGDGSFCDDQTGRFTMQTVFEDSADPDSPGYFVRGEDEAFTQRDAGCSRYHEEHDHWHFDNFARYRLLSEKTGNIVGGSRKISFCVIDTGQPHPELPGTPDEPYYPQDPGSEFASCSATSTDGLSIGWEDTYGASLPGQGIRVTKLRKGSYCLVLETDPAGPARPDGVLNEINEDNNARDIKVWLRPHKQIVRRQSHDCKAI
jgi:Lysyl oxidase